MEFTKKEIVIKTIIFSVLTILGVLCLIFFRNQYLIIFDTITCYTPINTLIHALKFLIFPFSTLCISFVFLIPALYGLNRLSKVLKLIGALATIGLSIFLSIQTKPGDVIFIILTIISFIPVLLIIISSPSLFFKGEIAIAVTCIVLVIIYSFSFSFLSLLVATYSTVPCSVISIFLKILIIVVLWLSAFYAVKTDIE